MPPKRKSALSSSKSKPLETPTQPFSSDGPTLPIITTTSQPLPTASIPTKRKSSETGHAQPNERGSHTLHQQLYTPWSLLPPQLQAEMQKGNNNEYGNIVPVVWSKNQNVRAGVNKVKTYLGFGAEAATKAKEEPTGTGTGNGIERPAALDAQDGIIAVSAQGEGTSKLVGILEVAKRVVEGSHSAVSKQAEGVEKEEEEEATWDWFVYTALSSVAVPVKKRGTAKEGSEEESDDAFETPVGSRGEGGKMRKEPVLTVWFCRRRNAGFERAFGEVVWRVRV
jgi:hypothetical protein